MQSDGNLVAYNGSTFHPQFAFWSSNTYGKGKPPYTLTLDRFGNLVIYGHFRNKVWETGTRSNDRGTHLRVQDDRNLVLYDGQNRVLWSSGTALTMVPEILVIEIVRKHLN